MKRISKIKQDKPWAVLKVTRRDYEAKRPWKAAGMTRDAFDNLVISCPPEMIDALWDESQADVLLRAMGLRDE